MSCNEFLLFLNLFQVFLLVQIFLIVRRFHRAALLAAKVIEDLSSSGSAVRATKDKDAAL